MNEICDARSCFAHAHLEATSQGGLKLYYCGHHGDEYAGKLMESGFTLLAEPATCNCEQCERINS